MPQQARQEVRKKLIFKPSAISVGAIATLRQPRMVQQTLLQLQLRLQQQQLDKQIMATVNRRAFLCQQNC